MNPTSTNPTTPVAASHGSPSGAQPNGGDSNSLSPISGTVVPAAVFSPPTPEDGAEAKRRRIARACDMCRKKKIKCDGKAPSCTHCTNYKTECLFTIVEKKRNPPKGAKYIEGLENRLGRMESLLKLSGLLPDGDDKTDLGDLERRLQESTGSSQKARSIVGRSSSESTSGATPNTPTSQNFSNSPKNVRAPGAEEDVEALSDQLCSLVTNNCGETRFIGNALELADLPKTWPRVRTRSCDLGASSGFSIFSPKGIEWVNEKTGDASFESMITHHTKDANEQSHCGQNCFFAPLSRRKGHFKNKDGKEYNVPPRDVAMALANDYFMSFNNLFPLFHEGTFKALLEKQYSDNPPKGSGWYAAFMVMLAIACRLRISHNRSTEELRDKNIKTNATEARIYFDNATSVITELLMLNTDLLTIQALVGMSLFMQGTANPQPAFFLVAAAVRIATSIGMHRKGNSFGLTPFESEQRRRLFWVLYMLDKDTALRSGRPPCINDDDCNVELPEENPIDGVATIPLMKEPGSLNLFRCMAQFAVIESKCYMQLYSTKASKQSDGELLNTIGQLDHELEQWKDSIPAEFRPENEMYLAERGPLVMHVVMLHFVYYNCLTTIHRMSIHHGYWSNRLANYAIAGLNARPLNPRVFSSAALCVAAARATVHLIKYLDPRDYPCIWLVMYYPVSALVTLFANVLQNPQDVQARSDLRLMQAVVEFLHNVLEVDKEMLGDDDGSVCRMLAVCGEFSRIATVVLNKVDKDAAARKKRKPEEPAGPVRTGIQPFKTSKEPTPKPSNPNAQQPVTATVAPADGMSVDPQTLYTNDLGSPFSGDTPMNWFNELETPKSSSATPPITMENFQNMPMLSANSFEQPFVPQDLWQMPMTFEWDWADVSNSMQWDSQPNNNNSHM